MTQTSPGVGHVRLSLGLYVMGMLPESERTAVKIHLSECGRCRDECVGLTDMPSLLAMLTERDIQEIDQLRVSTPNSTRPVSGTVAADATRPPPSRRESASARPPRDARGSGGGKRRPAQTPSRPAGPSRTTRLRRVGLAAAAVAVIAASAVGIGVWVRSPEQSIDPVLTASAVDNETGVSLSIVVTPDGAGARVKATVRGLRPDEEFQLIGVTSDGQTQVVARWTGLAGANTVTGNVTGSPSRLAFFTVTLPEGTPVVTVRVAA